MSFTIGNNIPDKIVSESHSHEMIFLGEYLHHDQRIKKYALTIVRELASRTDFRILAKESVYCIHPFLEQDSLNNSDSKYIDKIINDYNRQCPDDQKIIVTAIDIAHSINHTPELVRQYLQKMTDDSDKNFEKEISKLIVNLEKDEPLQKKIEFITELDEIIERYKKKLNVELLEELKFYVNLLTESLKHVPPKNRTEHIEMADIRSKCFIETIKRAIKRNDRYSAKMINYVGSPHAYKEYINEDDYYIGKVPEAKHFNDNIYPGKVYSILIRPFFRDYFGNITDKITNKIEKAALEKVGNEKSIYVDLREFKSDNPGLDNVGYYNERHYQYDGVLYIKDGNT